MGSVNIADERNVMFLKLIHETNKNATFVMFCFFHNLRFDWFSFDCVISVFFFCNGLTALEWKNNATREPSSNIRLMIVHVNVQSFVYFADFQNSVKIHTLFEWQIL